MRHRRRAKYFGVKTAHRKAMFRNMATSLFKHGRITTTVPRAKELRRIADKLVTLAKDGSLHARRQALAFIMDKAVVAKLFSEIGPQMAERRGGYTRIVKIGPRRGDGAMMCVIELVKESLKPSKSKAKKTDSEQVAPVVIPEAKESALPEAEESSKVEEEATTQETEAKAEEAVAEAIVQVEDTATEDVEIDGESKGEPETQSEIASEQQASGEAKKQEVETESEKE